MSSGQTNPHDAADPAAGDTGPPVVLPVVRDGRWWGTRGTGEGVVVFGRTLDQLRRSAKAALELRDGGPPPIVRLRPESPDLEALAAARALPRRAPRNHQRSADPRRLLGSRGSQTRAATTVCRRRCGSRTSHWSGR